MGEAVDDFYKGPAEADELARGERLSYTSAGDAAPVLGRPAAESYHAGARREVDHGARRAQRAAAGAGAAAAGAGACAKARARVMARVMTGMMASEMPTRR